MLPNLFFLYFQLINFSILMFNFCVNLNFETFSDIIQNPNREITSYGYTSI